MKKLKTNQAKLAYVAGNTIFLLGISVITYSFLQLILS